PAITPPVPEIASARSALMPRARIVISPARAPPARAECPSDATDDALDSAAASTRPAAIAAFARPAPRAYWLVWLCASRRIVPSGSVSRAPVVAAAVVIERAAARAPTAPTRPAPAPVVASARAEYPAPGVTLASTT